MSTRVPIGTPPGPPACGLPGRAAVEAVPGSSGETPEPAGEVNGGKDDDGPVDGVDVPPDEPLGGAGDDEVGGWGDRPDELGVPGPTEPGAVEHPGVAAAALHGGGGG